jgi:hypothetical protein
MSEGLGIPTARIRCVGRDSAVDSHRAPSLAKPPETKAKRTVLDKSRGFSRGFSGSDDYGLLSKNKKHLLPVRSFVLSGLV